MRHPYLYRRRECDRAKSLWWTIQRALTKRRTPHITSEMKQISARVFQRAFSKVADELQQGQTITITKRGKPLGFFTKAPASASVPMPDFAANLAGMPYAPKGAQRIVREVMDEPVS